MPPPRPPLYFTFGNHMHWVDMQWLWGYDVLPGSVRDMLHLIKETGTKGNVNFDGVGYEKMAAECPEALAELREAIARGDVEPVGCSYGQPYGLFQGGESNVRQFTYGVRTAMRLLGAEKTAKQQSSKAANEDGLGAAWTRPRAFWEEEFYFFPQLPQVLRQCGFTGACLYFQWTWHTPEVPTEPHSLILWEGADGTRLPTLPRNDLNVHQWPEDFDGLMEKAAKQQSSKAANEKARWGAPAVVQWLELMPSKDWMCRSEVLLPRLKELMGDVRFEVRARTCSGVIGELLGGHEGTEARRHEGGGDAAPPVRRYTMDDVWHGMTLGKNADRHPRRSREVEQTILAAESLAALAGLFGRPYPSWDVYPTWELDEAWRELLAAQHHDNHECEGLCGFVGYQQMNKAREAAGEVRARTLGQLQDRSDRTLLANPLGWEERVLVQSDEGLRLAAVPPFGYRAASRATEPVRAVAVEQGEKVWTLRRGSFDVDVDVKGGVIRQIRSAAFPEGVLANGSPLLDLAMRIDGAAWSRPSVAEAELDDDGSVTLWLTPDEAGRDGRTSPWHRGGSFSVSIALDPVHDAVLVEMHGIDDLARPDPGLHGALRTFVQPAFNINEIRADGPLSIEAVKGSGKVRRKYPTGDWMTSPQRFEEYSGSIVSCRLLDLVDANGRGLMISHDGSQQAFRDGDRLDIILNAHDPWDEQRYEPDLYSACRLRFEPHGPLRDAERLQRTLAFLSGVRESTWLDRTNQAHAVGGGGRPQDAPITDTFGALELTNAPNVLAHAFYRDSMKSGEHLPDWAGHRMARESNGACTHPYMIRLVEWDGEPAEVVLKLPGPIAMAAKVNLMGEVLGEGAEARTHEGTKEENARGAAGGFTPSDTRWLTPEPADPPDWARGEGAQHNGSPIPWSQLRFTMRPREIATIMADLVMGRKQFRDLDAKREVWATIHKQDAKQDAAKGGSA